MSLITTTIEARKAIPRLLSSLSADAELPNIRKAQRKYIKPLLGADFLEDLQDRYDDHTLGSDEELLQYIQLPLAAYAYLDDLAFSQVTLTDSGLRTQNTETMQATHRWEFLETRKALQDSAMDGVEQLLAYLYENKADYPLWTDSAEYRSIDHLLIKTGTDFAKLYPLSSPIYTFWTIKPKIADVEEMYLAAKLGRKLLNWIKDREEILILAEGAELDVKTMLKQAVAFLTIKHACEHSTPRFDQHGFTILAGGNPEDDSSGRTAASIADIEKKITVCDRDGQNYLSKATGYLIAMGEGKYGGEWDQAFIDAFDISPLKKIPDGKPYTDGNERRNFFVL